MPRSVKMSADAPGVTVTSADGRQLTLRRGLTFLDRPSATVFFQDFAKAQGKRLIINKKKSGGAQYEYVCASRSPCNFRIKLLKSRSAQSSHFFVSSFIAQHTATCISAPKLTVRQAAAVLLGENGVTPTSSIKQLQERLHESSGETISSRKAYRVRDRILHLAAGEFTKGFQRLESLLTGFQNKNHGAHVAFELDQTSGMFKRAFLAHPFVVEYQRRKGLQPIFGMDTANLASMNYRGQMFVVVGKDGNNQVISLCVAVAPQADVDNWRWFLTNCQEAQLDFSRAVIIADRTKALILAAEGLRLSLRQCTQHIIANLKVMVKNLATVQVEDLVWRAQAADSEAEFNSCLGMIGLTCPAAEIYLQSMDPRTWALFCIAQQVKLYGWNSTLFLAEDNKALLCLAPYDFMQHFMEKFMTHAYNQNVHAKKWIEDGKIFTEYAEKLLAEQRNAANFQVVQPSNDGVIFVTESRSFPPRRYRVDLNRCVCSCAYLLQMGVPCRHFLAGLAFFKRSSEEESFMDECFRVTNFAEQYDTQRTGSIELLLDSELQEDHAVRAPAVTRKRGRPKSKPFSANSEMLMTSAVTIGNTNLLGGEDALGKRQCSTCGLTGHSKRTCDPNALVSSPLVDKVSPDMII